VTRSVEILSEFRLTDSNLIAELQPKPWAQLQQALVCDASPLDDHIAYRGQFVKDTLICSPP
jgi:hypothetical protein